MNLPTICNKCGRIFESGFSVTGAEQVFMEGCTAGPCPKCGSIGTIPNGMYRFINGALTLLNSDNYSKSDLRYLTNELRKIRDNKASIEEVALEIEETSPKFSEILDLLPKTREEKRNDFQFWINTIISLLMLLTTFKPSTSNGNNINIEQVINVMYQSEELQSDYSKGIGRNEKCPCGSGLKFKKCHGDWRYELNESINDSIRLD